MKCYQKFRQKCKKNLNRWKWTDLNENIKSIILYSYNIGQLKGFLESLQVYLNSYMYNFFHFSFSSFFYQSLSSPICKASFSFGLDFYILFFSHLDLDLSSSLYYFSLYLSEVFPLVISWTNDLINICQYYQWSCRVFFLSTIFLFQCDDSLLPNIECPIFFQNKGVIPFFVH